MTNEDLMKLTLDGATMKLTIEITNSGEWNRAFHSIRALDAIVPVDVSIGLGHIRASGKGLVSVAESSQTRITIEVNGLQGEATPNGTAAKNP